MATNAALLKTVRQAHLYFGVFIAPALLFFAFTGAVQTIGLHETIRGSNYQPPAILVRLGQLHKKQTLDLPTRRPPAPAGVTPSGPASSSSRPATPAENTKRKNLVPMKAFFLLVSLGLASSTVTGLYMAYKYDRNARLITALWIAGIGLPVLFAII